MISSETVCCATKKRGSNYLKQYRLKNKEALNAAVRRWRSRNKDVVSANNSKWRAKNPDYSKRDSLKRRYGMSLEDKKKMLLLQEGKCAICETSTPSGKGWHVDHCHTTGRVRGILCHHCNLMIGHAKDSAKTLLSAINYLQFKRK